MPEKKSDKSIEKSAEELKDDELDSAHGGAVRSNRAPRIQNDAEYIHGVVVRNDSPLKK